MDHPQSYRTGFEIGDEFLKYWETLPKHGDAELPLRSSFNPADIPALLPHIFVAKRKSYDDYAVTLRGTWLEEFVGKVDPDQNIFDSYEGEKQAAYKAFIENVLSIPCVGVIQRSVVVALGDEYPFPTLFCPFLDNEEGRTLMIGVALMEGYKTWELDDMNFILPKTVFTKFAYVDIGSGTTDK